MSMRRKEVLEASVRILTPHTIQKMGVRLDSRKVLLTSAGIHRDWRGIAEQAGLDVNTISNGKIPYMEHCIQIWKKNPGTIGKLWTYLESMDRFDVIDDIESMVYDDYDKSSNQVGGLMTTIPPAMDDHSSSDTSILTTGDLENMRLGLGLQHYDALVLYADEDIDFVDEMVDKLEREYQLKLCLKDRDLLGGLQFETDSVVRLIVERCTRVIVILSQQFLKSNVNRFFTSFAHALSIEQRRRIVIPCQLEPYSKPAVIHFCHSLDYYRAGKYWNFWGKLRDSLRYQPNTIERDRIQEISTTSTLAVSPEIPDASLSPSQSPSIFSKIFRRADSKGKVRMGAASETSSHQIYNREVSDDGMKSDQDMHSDMNGHPCSSAIPIDKFPKYHTPQHSVSSASEESSDFMHMVGSLPDVPETPPVSPLSTTSSVALLLPGESTPSPRSHSKFFDRIFKSKQKRKDSS